jgi:hypothetical protein
VEAGEEVKIYAYKGCLAAFDSLVDNNDMPLWARDGDLLLQKLFKHESSDENGLFYKSSRVYSCWLDANASQYLEIPAIVTEKKLSETSPGYDIIYRILNVEDIEATCKIQQFKQLQLPEYKANSNKPIDEQAVFTNADEEALEIVEYIVEDEEGEALTAVDENHQENQYTMPKQQD